MPDKLKDYVPFKDFLQYASFVASIGASLAFSAAQTLAASTSFLNRTDDTILASVRYSAVAFTWSGALFCFALTMMLIDLLILTIPVVVRYIQPGKLHRPKVHAMLSVSAWTSLLLVAAATALVGEGMKVIDVRAGSMIQWALLASALPPLLLLAKLLGKDFGKAMIGIVDLDEKSDDCKCQCRCQSD